MEVANGKVFWKTVLLAEFLGTAGISLGVNMSDGSIVIPVVVYLMMMMTGSISGGHLNPAVTLGVYIERKELGEYGVFAMGIVIAQALGAMLALPVGYMLRVSVIGDHGHELLEPRVNSFAPPVLVATDGKPAYGQVMLAETIGGFFFVMMVLMAKQKIYEGADPAIWVATMAAALYVCGDIFRDVSGGFINPAVALAQMIWQHATVSLDPTTEFALWTFEYSICYLIGPLVGAFVAGTVYNYVTQTVDDMQWYGAEEDEQAVLDKKIAEADADDNA